MARRREPNRGSSRPHRTDAPGSRPSPDGEPDLLGDWDPEHLDLTLLKRRFDR